MVKKSLPYDLFIQSPFWNSRFETIAHPVATRMMQDLDASMPLGIGDAAKPFWKGFKHNYGDSDSNIDFLFRVKKIHPQKIVLIQIGEFYETWGVDSIFLVEHCGINRMGRKGPRAGMPIANIQAVLNDLTEAGFSVVVCEQADDIHKKGRKVRFISEIITPSSPTYTYGLAMSHKANICFPEAPPEFGIATSIKGVKLLEINPDLRTVLILEGLTEEAATIRLNKYSGRMNRIFVHDKISKTLCDAANLKFQNLVKISGYSSKAFATRVEELIKIDLGLDANVPFTTVENLQTLDCPYPLYQQTAEQIGILPKKGIPDLVALMLPKGSPATCKYIVRNILLNPPPKKYADSLRQAILELLAENKNLPILIVSNPVRYIKTLNKSEAHPEILKDLFCLAEIFLNCQKNFSQNFIANSLEIVSYISSIKSEEKILQNTAKKIIAILADILPKEEDSPYVPSSELIPATLFERIEEEFRGRIAKTSSKEIADLYEKSEKLAKKYEEILTTKLIPIIQTVEKSKRIALSYDIHNNAIWMLGSVGAKAVEEFKLIRPIDRYGKEVKDRWTVKEVEEVLAEYKNIAIKTHEAIRQILKQAAKELSPYCLPIIHLATFSNLLKTFYLHIKECQVKSWTLNFFNGGDEGIGHENTSGHAELVEACCEESEQVMLRQAQYDTKGYDAKEKQGMGCVEAKPVILSLSKYDEQPNGNSSIAITDFFPYWMKSSEAVTNSINFNGTCLLTGHNMSGKSTLIRSLAAATLIGSCGFMFPAKKLSISQAIDGWYVRTGASDDPEAGLSAFAVEMTDIKVALRDATKKSFLLIDELGKGTESKAGHAIAASVLEHLAEKNIRSIFATHWHEIFANKAVNLQNVRLIKMKCDGDIPTYHVVEGFDLNSSAFYTAEKIGVDEKIIARAKEIEQCYESLDAVGVGGAKENNLVESFLKLNGKNSTDHIKSILAAIAETEISQIKNLKENETPPLNDIGHSIVYVLKTANNFYYAGETDNFLHRVISHRNKGKCEFFYTSIKSGKSQARQIEQKLITKLKNSGFAMLSIADETNSNFGARAEIY